MVTQVLIPLLFASSISSKIFGYNNGSPPPVNLIRVVEINLVLEKEGREISLTSSAQLRNIHE